MGFFSGIIKGAFDVVMLPVDVAKDVVDEGVKEDRAEKRIDDIFEDVGDIFDGDIL